MDRDYVEESNLQRQSLFDEADAALGPAQGGGRGGAPARRSTPTSTVRGVVADLAADNAAALLAGADLVLDGTDNFETRFLLNDVCVRAGMPWVYGACVGSYGLALAGPPARVALPALPARGDAGAGLGAHLRHRGRGRAHRARGRRHAGAPRP